MTCQDLEDVTCKQVNLPDGSPNTRHLKELCFAFLDPGLISSDLHVAQETQLARLKLFNPGL